MNSPTLSTSPFTLQNCSPFSPLLGRLAPVPTGGAWLALKALPLALLLPGTARGAAKPRQILSLLLPWYAAEGIVRAYSESGRHALVAATAGALAIATFVCLLAWVRKSSG